MSLVWRILTCVGVVFSLMLVAPFALIASGAYKTFHMPSESMEPTYDVGDRLAARMSRPDRLRRGDIVIADAGGGRLYLKRIAGLPGDRIALADGIVSINGSMVTQRQIGTVRVEQDETARHLVEQFPGEATPHRIYDTSYSTGDDMDEQVVSPGHLFLLGDNRDHSADSRFSREMMGLEQVPLEHVRGAPLFFYWTAGANRIFDDASH